MATLVVLPSKFKQDVQRYVFSFQNILKPDEIISSADISVTVFTGEDLDPEHILFGTLVFTDKNVEHILQEGVPGVIYEVSVTVVSDLAYTYNIQARLAIIPENLNAPTNRALITLSSKIYPIQKVDSLVYGVFPVEGSLRTIIIELSFDDTLSYAAVPVGGLLRYAIHDTFPKDTLSYSVIPNEGVLRQALHSNTPEEFLRYSVIPREGSLRAALVSHTHNETLQYGLIPVTGALYVG